MSEIMDKIKDAQKVLDGVTVVTPIITAPGLCEGAEVYIKAENLQRTGSFKLRGAYYFISRLTEEEKSRGVIACSAGNHAQGVALAAAEEGIKCIICMPENASISKIQRTESYGAKVILVPGPFENSTKKARELEKEHGHVFIHPFDCIDIIAGQGTVGLEICEQVPDADIVLAAVGGGGLLAGVAAAIKHINPSCLVYGVEAANAASMKRSIDYNQVVMIEDTKNTIADGIAVKCPGNHSFELIRQYADGIITVDERQITLSMLKLIEDYKLLVEGAGAVTIAAVMYGKVDIKGKKVVCIASGGNVDVNLVEKIIGKGLRQTGRVTNFTIALEDIPGALRVLLDVMAEKGANIISLNHNRIDLGVEIDQCVVDVTFESRGVEHQQEILDSIFNAGFVISRKIYD